eukprot:6968639-Prymnesium_polylepis.2
MCIASVGALSAAHGRPSKTCPGCAKPAYTEAASRTSAPTAPFAAQLACASLVVEDCHQRFELELMLAPQLRCASGVSGSGSRPFACAILRSPVKSKHDAPDAGK